MQVECAHLPVDVAMSHPPATLAESETTKTARELLLGKRFRLVPIVSDDGRLVGVVAASDLLSAGDRTLGDVMTRAVIVVHGTDTLADAARLMTGYDIEHLVVVDDRHQPVGVLAARDIADCLSRCEVPASVVVAMRKDFVTVEAHAPLSDCAGHLRPGGVATVLVTDQHGICGAVNQLDVLAQPTLDKPTRSAMNYHVTLVPEETPITEAAGRFAREPSTVLLIVDDEGALLGVLTAKDLTRFLAATPPRF